MMRIWIANLDFLKIGAISYNIFDLSTQFLHLSHIIRNPNSQGSANLDLQKIGR